MTELLWNAIAEKCYTCGGDKIIKHRYSRLHASDWWDVVDTIPCGTCNGRGWLIQAIKDENVNG